MTSNVVSRLAVIAGGVCLLLGAASVELGHSSARRAEPAAAAAIMRRAMWKPQTHIFAANLALIDALDGSVSIPPYGQFPVAATALRALRAAPASYRAGVLAPDLFPDMYVGGWFIHSDLAETPDKWIADDWMRFIWKKAWQFDDPANPAQKDKVMAFAYGFLTHAAGDMFAHTYVNQKADGAWNNPNPSTVKKHITLEGYVGLRTPDTDLTLDVWPRFVSNTLIHDPSARQHISAPHYRTFTRIHDWLGPQIERARQEMNRTVGKDAPYAVKCVANPVPCAKKEQMEAWRLDIERGFRALVDSNQTLGEKIMTGKTREGVGAIRGWATEWVPKMFGAHAVGEGAAAMQELLDWIGDPLAPITKPIRDEVERFLKREFAEYYALYEALDDPAYWMENVGFPAGTKEIVNREMHLASDSLLSWRGFEPLYNTVILSKLALLDGDALNALAARAGVTQQLFAQGEQTNIMLGVFKSMTLSYQWMGEVVNSDTGATRTRFGICGPEDGSVLPKEALCGIEQQSSKPLPTRGRVLEVEGEPTARTGGFAFWGHPDAREKVFRVVFKGYGPGPGSVTDDVVLGPGGPRVDTRPTRAATEQLERMREVVALMRGKIGGMMPVAAAAGAAGAAGAAATPAQRSVPANIRVPGRVAAGRAAPAAGPGGLGGPPQQGEGITNWGQRCCAKEIGELRASVAALTSASTSPQMRTTRAGIGRPGAMQLAAQLGMLGTAIDAFANTSDSQSAEAALSTIASSIERVARIVAGGTL